MKCLIAGDSFAMPTEELAYEDTWPHLLYEEMPGLEIISKAERSRSVRSLNTGGYKGNGWDFLELIAPDFVIMHLGISDCAPRLLKREATLTKLLNLLPFSKMIYNIVRKTKGRTISCSDLSPEVFYDNVARYMKRAQDMGVTVFIIKISNGGQKVIKISPHFNEAVDLYNTVFDRIGKEFNNAVLIEGIDGSDESVFQSDGIHLLKNGNQIIFNRLKAAIKEHINHTPLADI